MNGHYEIGDVVLNNWKLVRLIGEGSYGKVFEAQREDYGLTYRSAIKIITIPKSQSEITSVRAEGMDDASVTAYFQSFVERIAKEFALMAQLKGTANIVGYMDHDTIRHEDQLGWDIIIRMELLTPLLNHTIEHGLRHDDVIKLGIDMCKALELCRKQSIIHRDIKPENIFLSELGDYKLGDFGIARTMEETSGATIAGTYKYMAPEIYKEQPYNFTVDMYSLGVVLYQMLNRGRTPFLPPYPTPIRHSDQNNAIARRMSGEPIPAPLDADEALAAVVLKACAYRPEDRYASPTEMREALEALPRTDTDSERDAFVDETVSAALRGSSGGSGRPFRTGEFSPPQPQGADAPAAGGDDALGATVGLYGARPASDMAPPPGDGTVCDPRLSTPQPYAPEPGASYGGAPMQNGSFAGAAGQPYPPMQNGSFAGGPGQQPPQNPDGSFAGGFGPPFGTVPDREGTVSAPQGNPARERKQGGGLAALPKNVKIAAGAVAAVLVIVVGILAVRGIKNAKTDDDGAGKPPTEVTGGGTAQQPSQPSTPGNPVTPPQPGIEPPQPARPELVWSEWADVLPEGIAGADSAIEAKLQYRTAPLIRTVNEERREADGFHLERQEYGDFGGWSSWQNSYVASSETREVRTQGGGSTWSGWSDWSQTPVSSNSSRQVETRTRDIGLSIVTEYRYRTLTGSSTRYSYRDRSIIRWYYNSNEWSEFGDEAIPCGDDHTVNYRMVYRYASSEDGRFGEASMENFPVFDADYRGRFADVDDETAWYGAGKSDILRTVCELGLLLPDTRMSFHPDDGVTAGQAIRAAVIVNRVYNGCAGLLCANNGNYQPYADYAVANGIVQRGEFPDLTQQLTRQELAYILSRALPEAELVQTTEIGIITDVDTGAYFDGVLKLARAGVVSIGADGAFRPNDPASRVQAASMLDRLVYPQHRANAR